MLPDRSKRYAGIDGAIPRLRLATVWQLALIALLMVGLLAVIFPRKALVEKLLTQEQLDPLTLSYVENLQRTDPGNIDLALLVARVQRSTLGVSVMERLLEPVLARGDERQRTEANTLLVATYMRALDANPQGAQYARLRNPLANLLTTLRPSEVSPRLASMLASAAFRIQMAETGLAYLNRAHAGRSTDILVEQARAALGVGQYALAAEYFFLARRQSNEKTESRKLLREGVGALMQASMFRQAMASAEREIGDLADDPDTLRYLARTSLAAGDPPRAAGYARKLVFRDFGVLTGTAPAATTPAGTTGSAIAAGAAAGKPAGAAK